MGYERLAIGEVSTKAVVWILPDNLRILSEIFVKKKSALCWVIAVVEAADVYLRPSRSPTILKSVFL